jgi:hypothetical protein
MDQKTQEFIAKAKEVHAEYNYDYSEAMYVNKRTKVKIYCPKHDNWFTPLPGVHINQKTRCKLCGKESGSLKQTNSKDGFIANAKNLHGDRYDYSKTDYINSYTKVDIICKEHGLFSIRPKDHIRANGEHAGCPKCGDIRAAIKRTKSTEYFIEKAKVAHGEEKFDYSKVDYKHSDTNIKVVCRKHNLDFEVTPSNFTKNIHNCPECVKENYNQLQYTTEEFVFVCKKIHGEEKYDYSKVEYTGACNKIIIICKTHGEFSQFAADHKNGFGCSSCSSSRGENAIKLYLETNNIKFEQQKTFAGCIYKSSLRFDFYLPDFNTCIEFQGIQHHKSVKYFGGEEGFQETLLRDEIKSDYCKNNYIELICLSDISEIELKLSKFSELQLV